MKAIDMSQQPNRFSILAQLNDSNTITPYQPVVSESSRKPIMSLNGLSSAHTPIPEYTLPERAPVSGTHLPR